MSRLPSARLRGAATVVVLLAGARPLCSQERPAPPPAASSARIATADTLEAARDDIRGLKAGREARSMAEGRLPRVAAPEWHGGAAPTPPLVRPVQPSPPAETRNPNWLIDALQQPDASTVLARERDDTRSGPPGARIASDRADPSRSRTSQTPVDSRGARERSPTGLGPSGVGMITNPLNAFLDDWMTPQDFALLKPGLSGRSTGVQPLPDFGLATGGLPSGPPLAAGVFRGADPVPLAAPGDRPGPMRENPFLAALNAPVANLAAAVQTPRLAHPAQGPATVATPAVQSPPSPPPASRTPDFARPAAEEKYFKPLKRF